MLVQRCFPEAILGFSDNITERNPHVYAQLSLIMVLQKIITILNLHSWFLLTLSEYCKHKHSVTVSCLSTGYIEAGTKK